jgi:hypothetical protein
MKIELHISFDSMEDYNDFSSRLDESSIKLKIKERSQLKEEIKATPEILPVKSSKRPSICVNPDCQGEFDPNKAYGKVYCSKQCYMHVYWQTHTKRDGNVVIRDNEEFSQKLEKLKRENPAPIQRPEYNRDC